MTEQILGKQNNFEVYKRDSSYFYKVNDIIQSFAPYKINGSKDINNKQVYFDIDDFVEACTQYCDTEFVNKVTDILHNEHLKDVENVWKKIKYIEELKLGQ